MTDFVGPTITLAELTLRFALWDEGVRERPPGSNRGPEVDGYLRSAGLDPERGSYPWCAAFITHNVKKAAQQLNTRPTFRGSPSVALLLARNPTLVIPAPEPRAVFLHIGPKGNHCGFVISPHDDGSLVTFEGNSDASGSRTGGCVLYNRRPAGYATHFLRIA